MINKQVYIESMAEDESGVDFFMGLIITAGAGFVAWIGWQMLSQIDSLTLPTEGVMAALLFFVGAVVYYSFY